MTRRVLRGLLAAVVVLLVASSATASATAPGTVADLGADRTLSQEDPTETPDDESAEGGAGGAQTNSSSEVVAEVDDQLRVSSYRYNASSETFVVSLENHGEEESSVTITEWMSEDASATGRFGIELVTVPAGETITAKIDLRTGRDPPAVMLVTSRSAEKGHGTFLEADETESGGLFSGVPTWTDVWVGVGVAILFMAVVVVLGVWYVVARESNDVAEVNV